MDKTDIRKFFLIIISSYMVLEVAYRITILNLSVESNVDESTMQAVEWFGCFLAGFGVTLVLNRIRILNLFISMFIFFCVFFGMRWFIEHCVDYISIERKQQAVFLSKQKLIGLNQKTELPLLNNTVYSGTFVEKIILANASSVAYVQNVNDTKSQLLATVVDVELEKDILTTLSEMYEIENKHFMDICKCQGQVDSYNRLYGSDRWQHPIGKRYGRALSKKNFTYKSFTLNAFDVPLGISRARFEYWLQESMKHELRLFIESNVSKKNTASFARWIWFTPVSLALSLFSLIFNFASFITLILQGPIEKYVRIKYASIVQGILSTIIWFGIVFIIYWISISSNIPTIAESQIQTLYKTDLIGKIWAIAQIIDIRIFG